MFLRRTFARGLIASLLLIILSACVTANTPAIAPLPTTTTGEASAPVTLVLWHGWSGPQLQVLGGLVDRFNRQRSNGRVLVQSVPLASLSGDLRSTVHRGAGPHIVLMPSSWIGGLAREDVLLPLDEAIPQSEQQALLPVTIGGARAPGSDGASRLYGLPISFDTLALYYNRANISDAPQSTDRLLDIGRGLSDPNAPRWGLALNLTLDSTIGYLYAFDGRIFDDQGAPVLGTTGRPGAERWLNWLVSLKSDQELLVRPDAGIQVDRELKNKNVIMTFAWAHQLADYRRLWGDQLGVAPLPRLSETGLAPRPYVQGQVLAINSRSGPAERNAAVEFLRFMASEEAQRELLLADLQPARADLKLDGGEPLFAAARAFRTQAESAQPIPNGPDREVVRQVLVAMHRKVLFDLASPADAISEADGRLRALFNQSAP